MKSAFGVVAVACLLLTPGPAAASLEQARADTQIAEDVTRSVNTYTRFTVFDDVCVDVQNGVLTLPGE